MKKRNWFSLLFSLAASLLVATPSWAQVEPTISHNSGDARGDLAGVTLGYDWQNGSIVYGLETDFSVTNLSSNMNSIPFGGDSTASTNSHIKSVGTLHERLGFTSGQWLIYGTGGFAYGALEQSNSLSDSPFSVMSAKSKYGTGWVAGGGMDYMISPDLQIGLQYQYIDLGKSIDPPPVNILNIHTVQNANLQTIMLRLSWKFSTDRDPSKPWQGGHLGGELGGGWGNKTDAEYSGVLAP